VTVLALSVVCCLLNPPGFTSTTSNVLSGVALAVTAIVLIALPSVRRVTLGQPAISGERSR
jgi:drug/metabolite transporter (DMT)-like permease